MPTCKVWIYRLLFVYLFFVFVRIRISPPRIKLAASNFARRFIGVQGRESHILGNFAPPEAQNRTIRTHWPIRTIGMRRSLNISRRVDVGLCRYTAVPKDVRTCSYFKQLIRNNRCFLTELTTRCVQMCYFTSCYCCQSRVQLSNIYTTCKVFYLFHSKLR